MAVTVTPSAATEILLRGSIFSAARPKSKAGCHATGGSKLAVSNMADTPACDSAAAAVVRAVSEPSSGKRPINWMPSSLRSISTE